MQGLASIDATPKGICIILSSLRNDSGATKEFSIELRSKIFKFEPGPLEFSQPDVCVYIYIYTYAYICL